MQTPQGHEIIDGRAVPVDWFAVIFNPSFPYRLAHMVVAAFLATALVVGAPTRKMLAMAMAMVLVTAPIQAVIGDLHGLNTLQHQPAKLAAIECHWENKPGEGVPLVLIGIPDMEAETTRYAVEVPNLGSLLLTHSWTGQFPGLKEFPREDRPNSLVVFWSFRLMVGLGFLMILLGAVALWLRWRGGLYESKAFHRFAAAMGPAGIVAILAGWITMEVGRQPWVVYGLQRTADAVSPHSLETVGVTLAIFVVVYVLVFGAGTTYLLRIMGQGLEAGESSRPVRGGPGEMRQPMRPMSGARDRLDPMQPAVGTTGE